MAAYSQAVIQDFLKVADQATTLAARGKAFEDLICYLFAANGITGSAEDGKAAHFAISSALAKSIRIVVITREEVELLKSSDDLVLLIKQKLCHLVASETAWP
jgi:hypothetical protein